MKICHITDIHIQADETHDEIERLRIASRMIAEEKPDVVVVGEAADFPSLLQYRGSPLAGGDGHDEGLDLEADKKAFRMVFQMLRAETDRQNERHRRARRKDRIHETAWVYCAGNHDDEHDKTSLRYRVLRSLINTRILQRIVEEEGFQFIPFLEPCVIGGVVFQHYVPGEIRKRALAINSHLSKCESIITGHRHTFEVRTVRTHTGKLRTAIVAGCYKPYSRLRNHEESGILMLHDVEDGEFRYEWLPLAHLARKYGEGSISNASGSQLKQAKK